MMLPDPSIQKVQPPGYIEQSVSIDPHVSQKKRKDLWTKRRRRKPPPDDDEDARMNENPNSEHIDYRA